VKKIVIINGPNLNLLGSRETVLYGAESFDEVMARLRKSFPGAELSHVQYNDETGIIDAIHRAAATGAQGIVLNPAAYTHTSVAIADAVAAVSIPVVEVHISNVHGREPFRQHSFVSRYAAGVITGFGVKGYALAITFLCDPA
jgi:3-dehydroquinate dehydratase-2